MTRPAPLLATLAAALIVSAAPAAAQDADLSWTDPFSRVAVPEPSRTRGLRATNESDTEADRARGFVPIVPMIPRPLQTGPRSWQICNASRHGTVSVAVAVPADENWHVRGWLLLDQGECRVVLKGSTANEVYYLSHPATGRLPGWQSFCIRTDSGFQTVAEGACPDGYIPAGFRRVALDRSSVRTEIR